MGDPGNNGTTVGLNKPINLIFSKRVWLLWYELSIQNLYKLSTFICSYVLFKAVLFSIYSGKISCNNILNAKLNLRKSNLSELTNTQNVKRRSICFVFYGKRSKVCCDILHRWSHLLDEFNKSGGSKLLHSKDSLYQ